MMEEMPFLLEILQCGAFSNPAESGFNKEQRCFTCSFTATPPCAHFVPQRPYN